MSGYVFVGDNAYKCSEINAVLGQITFTFDDAAITTTDAAQAIFADVTSLHTGNDDQEVHGDYDYVEFDMASINANGQIMVTMRIPDKTEQRLMELERKVAKITNEQNVQNAALMELASLQ